MTTGAVIFALNNSSIDYVQLAIFAAQRVQHFLKIPVSVITNSSDWILKTYATQCKIFDQIIAIDTDTVANQKRFHDGSLTSKFLEWNNLDRNTVYDLTPYARTLVLDSDYILNSTQLLPAVLGDHAFEIYQQCVDISSWRSTEEFDNINQYSIPFYWATVFVFEKTVSVKAFFQLVSHVKHNWQYFRTLYSIEVPTFRNDYAFSIAIHIMNGQAPGIFAHPLPGCMTFASDRDFLIGIDNAGMKFLTEKQNYLGEYTAATVCNTDVHVLNKASLSRYITGGTGV